MDPTGPHYSGSLKYTAYHHIYVTHPTHAHTLDMGFQRKALGIHIIEELYTRGSVGLIPSDTDKNIWPYH